MCKTRRAKLCCIEECCTPGYDLDFFSKYDRAILQEYGGANSHMATIRLWRIWCLLLQSVVESIKDTSSLIEANQIQFELFCGR